LNWFGSLPAGSEGFEYHLLAVGLGTVVVLNGSGAFSLDRWLTTRPSHTRNTLRLGALAASTRKAA
jgi:hypothetical protein